MEKAIYVALVVSIIFGVNLIVSGIPVDKVATTTQAPEENETSEEKEAPNGTHKEL